MFKTFKYRLYPTSVQEQRMSQVLDVCCHWYNMCLSERKWKYELEAICVTKFQQEHTGIWYRKTFPQAKIVFSQTLQAVCGDLDKAFQAFFRRVKSGEKPGYPRFKHNNRFHSFVFNQFGVGAKLDGRRLKLFRIGRVAVRWHRPIEGTIKTLRIIRKAGKWYACFSCEIEIVESLPLVNQAIGIDVGINALFTTSNGDRIDNPLYYHAGQQRLGVLQRKLTSAKEGSNNYKKIQRTVQLQHEHVANQRRDFLHKLSTNLVRKFDQIALEDLNIRKMVNNHLFSKSILDSGWYLFRQYLTYKAENAGREIVFVNPAYTSRSCSKCGATFKDFNLSTRWVECECGLSLDRDHNAAINILNRAGWGTPVPNTAGNS